MLQGLKYWHNYQQESYWCHIQNQKKMSTYIKKWPRIFVMFTSRKSRNYIHRSRRQLASAAFDETFADRGLSMKTLLV